MPSAALNSRSGQPVDLLEGAGQRQGSPRARLRGGLLAQDRRAVRRLFPGCGPVLREPCQDALQRGHGRGDQDGQRCAGSRRRQVLQALQKTYQLKAEPGRVYGFIADAEGGVPVGINVKKEGTDEFLRDAKDKRQSSELELAPTAWDDGERACYARCYRVEPRRPAGKIRTPCLHLGGA